MAQDDLSPVLHCPCFFSFFSYIPMLKELVKKARCFNCSTAKETDLTHATKNIVYIRLGENFQKVSILKPQNSNQNKRPLLVLGHDQTGHTKGSYIIGNKWFLLKGYRTPCFSWLLSPDAGTHAMATRPHPVLATFQYFRLPSSQLTR